MSLLNQQYRAKKKFERLLKDYGAKKNIEIPDTMDIKKMPRELGLEACLDSQNRNSKCEII